MGLRLTRRVTETTPFHPSFPSAQPGFWMFLSPPPTCASCTPETLPVGGSLHSPAERIAGELLVESRERAWSVGTWGRSPGLTELVQRKRYTSSKAARLPSPPLLAITILLSASLSSTTVEPSYKWNQATFLLLWLASFALQNVHQVHPCFCGWRDFFLMAEHYSSVCVSHVMISI